MSASDPAQPPQTAAIALRRARTGDARTIGAVFDAAVRAHWTWLGERVEEPLFAPEDWTQLVDDHAPPNVLLVATEPSGRVVGFTGVHPEDGELFLLFVDPDRGGQGIGRALLAAAHRALRAAGCRQAHLFTHEQNERALAVYAAAGYRPDGTTRGAEFRGLPFREIRLVKRLEAA